MSSLEFKGANSIKLAVFGKIYSTVTALSRFLLFQRYIVFFKVRSPNKKKKVCNDNKSHVYKPGLLSFLANQL